MGEIVKLVKLVVDVNRRFSNSSQRIFTMYFENEKEMNKFLMDLDHISKVRFVYKWEHVDSIPEDEDSDDSDDNDETEVSEDEDN